MEKILIVCWGGPKSPDARRSLIVDHLGPALVEAGAQRLQAQVADLPHVPSTNPIGPSGPDPVALISAWVEDAERAAPLLERVEAAGLAHHAWLVAHDVYTDYGEHPAMDARDWPDGEPSRAIASVNFLERPESVPLDTWIERWHGRMSPVSAEIQPRVRYVRNLLVSPLTEDAPEWQAIVEELWPSPAHVAKASLFYGASNPFALARNMGRVLAAVTSFLRPWRVRAVMMSEYFLHTEAKGVPAERRADGPPRRDGET